jgi:ribokinase
VNAVDSTGAGDSFTAGFLYGWARGMSLSASALLASALGALATMVYGAGSSLPDKQALLDFLRAEKMKGHTVQVADLNEVIAALENKEQ